jgi:hypothetical protein
MCRDGGISSGIRPTVSVNRFGWDSRMCTCTASRLKLPSKPSGLGLLEGVVLILVRDLPVSG